MSGSAYVSGSGAQVQLDHAVGNARGVGRHGLRGRSSNDSAIFQPEHAAVRLTRDGGLRAAHAHRTAIERCPLARTAVPDREDALACPIEQDGTSVNEYPPGPSLMQVVERQGGDPAVVGRRGILG